MRKLDKILKKINKLEYKLKKNYEESSITNLISKYSDNSIIEAFKVLYPNVYMEIEKEKTKEIKNNNVYTISENNNYDIEKAFNALYKDSIELNEKERENRMKNEKFNKIIRGQPVEIDEDEKGEQKNEKFNEIFRTGSSKKTNEILQRLFGKGNNDEI